MISSELKGRFFLQNESIRITNQIESIRIANWNALVWCVGEQWRRQGVVRRRAPSKMRALTHSMFALLWCQEKPSGVYKMQETACQLLRSFVIILLKCRKATMVGRKEWLVLPIWQTCPLCSRPFACALHQCKLGLGTRYLNSDHNRRTSAFWQRMLPVLVLFGSAVKRSLYSETYKLQSETAANLSLVHGRSLQTTN